MTEIVANSRVLVVTLFKEHHVPFHLRVDTEGSVEAALVDTVVEALVDMVAVATVVVATVVVVATAAAATEAVVMETGVEATEVVALADPVVAAAAAQDLVPIVEALAMELSAVEEDLVATMEVLEVEEDLENHRPVAEDSDHPMLLLPRRNHRQVLILEPEHPGRRHRPRAKEILVEPVVPAHYSSPLPNSKFYLRFHNNKEQLVNLKLQHIISNII